MISKEVEKELAFFSEFLGRIRARLVANGGFRRAEAVEICKAIFVQTMLKKLSPQETVKNMIERMERENAEGDKA